MKLIANIVVGACLKKHRLAHHMTQRELARLMCRRQPYISLIENGLRGINAVDLLLYLIVLGDEGNEILNEIREKLIKIGCFPKM